LNDGKDTFVHAVLDTGGTVQVPAKFSVIRISSEETPDHIKNPTIMSISKDNKDKFALIISHYQLGMGRPAGRRSWRMNRGRGHSIVGVETGICL